jgi:tetratricopeptide (TPR) repeat protein
MISDNLVQYLPSDLDEAVKRSLAPGENALISLPGALGEAIVVTNKRIAIAREKNPVDGVAVFSYQLGTINNVNVGSSTTGGMLTLETQNAADVDDRTVYFASYDKSKFDAAAERIKNLLAVAHAVGTQPLATLVPTTTAVPVASGLVCPSCGVSVSESDSFCSICGVKIKDTCRICSAPIPVGGKFCPHCGIETVVATTECPACGGRVNSSAMSYCPQCGTGLSATCTSCGGSIISGWPRCRYCGREIGSEALPGRSFRMIRERATENASAEASTAELEEQPKEVKAFAESPAAQHNARGAELFEQENIDEAIEEFRRAVTLEPNDASYHCNLAAAYDEAGQSEDARREYERTLELNPEDITALLYLGYLLNENDEQERAAELWRRVTEVAPGTPEAEEAQQGLRAQDNL